MTVAVITILAFFDIRNDQFDVVGTHLRAVRNFIDMRKLPSGRMETVGGIGRGGKHGTLQKLSYIVGNGSKMNSSAALSFSIPFSPQCSKASGP
jgi:hypothetical protein